MSGPWGSLMSGTADAESRKSFCNTLNPILNFLKATSVEPELPVQWSSATIADDPPHTNDLRYARSVSLLARHGAPPFRSISCRARRGGVSLYLDDKPDPRATR